VRPALLRSLAVLAVGLVITIGILYYASTVDGRPPLVERIELTQHQPADPEVALTTTTIEVVFSEAVREVSAEGAFRVEPATAGEFAWSGTTMTFTPNVRLPLETAFRAWVAAGVLDEAGNVMSADSDALEFTTVGPPDIAATEPIDGAQDAPLDGPIVITFSVLMDTASVEEALRISPTVQLEVAWEGEKLSLTHADQLAEGARYTVTIGTAARDSTGEPLAAPFRFSFTTTRSPLEASLLVPADGTDGVATTTPIAAFFDRAVDTGSLSADSMSIEPEVAGDLELIAAPGAAGIRDPAQRILRFQPSAPLQPNTTYHVVVDAGLAGADGSQLGGTVEWSFTTGAPRSSLANQVVFLSDRAGIANLWAMNPDGSVQRQLSAELSPVTNYAVAPNGRSFIVADGAVLVLQAADGSDRELLTTSDAIEYDPTWSPDGSSFAFGRSDRATGEGLGLWIGDAQGGNERRIELPDELVSGASPGPRASPSEEGGQLLRAPRYSPDGAALAFVDMTGRVGVVELPAGRLTTARLVATAPPVWLRDSTGVLLAAVAGGGLERPAPGQPFPDLSPASPALTVAQRASLHSVRLDRGGQRAETLDLPRGAWIPAVSRDAVLVILAPATAPDAAGELWLSLETVDPRLDRRLLDDSGSPILFATFGVDAESGLAARSGGGIWLVDVPSGRGRQLSDDGWLPSWLP
jgi:Bacterial Ig-like domain/WD40-like Beta Propeller Repeat